MKLKVRITQVFRVERSVIVEVDKRSDAEPPAFDDPRWTETWDIRHEEITAAREVDNAE